jgi:serine/threonine-protein kinase
MRIAINEKTLESGVLKKGITPHDSEDRFAGHNILLRSEPRQAEPSMICDGSGCLVVWDDETGGAFAGFVPPGGEAPLWHREFSTKGKRPVVARSDDGGAAVAFFAGDRLFIAPVDRDGIGDPSVLSRVSGFQPQPSLVSAGNPGEWLIAWRDYEAGHLEVFVARAHCSPGGDKR